MRISILLILLCSNAWAGVASQSAFKIFEVENPSALKIDNQKKYISFRSLSGSGTYKQGLLEREKLTTSETKGLLGYIFDSYAIQLVFMPQLQRSINEITQYDRASIEVKEEEIQFNFSKEYSQNLKWGLGIDSRSKTQDEVKAQKIKIKSGVNYLLSESFSVGVSANLINSESKFEQNQSWVESHAGLAWKQKIADTQVQLETSLARSPKVYQRPNTDIGGNYQREWSQNILSLDVGWPFGFGQLCAAIDKRSRKYKALEVGEDELEDEQNILLGYTFGDNGFGIFGGQNVKENRLAGVKTSLTSTIASLMVSF